MSYDVPDYYELPPHTHVADVALHLSETGYMVEAVFVDARNMDNPIEHRREWFINSPTPLRDAHRNGWVFDDRQMQEKGHVFPQFPPPSHVHRTGRELLQHAAGDARLSATPSERAVRTELAAALTDKEKLGEQVGASKAQGRYAEFELAHVEPQDNVYAWFRNAITQTATYGNPEADFGLDQLTDGWKLLQEHGPASPEVFGWFAAHSELPPFEVGEELLHPHQGSSAHQSTIEHLHQFQHEFNGTIEQTVSVNVAAAIDTSRERTAASSQGKQPAIVNASTPAQLAAGPFNTGTSSTQAVTGAESIRSSRPAHLARQNAAQQHRTDIAGRRL